MRINAKQLRDILDGLIRDGKILPTDYPAVWMRHEEVEISFSIHDSAIKSGDLIIFDLGS